MKEGTMGVQIVQLPEYEKLLHDLQRVYEQPAEVYAPVLELAGKAVSAWELALRVFEVETMNPNIRPQLERRMKGILSAVFTDPKLQEYALGVYMGHKGLIRKIC